MESGRSRGTVRKKSCSINNFLQNVTYGSTFPPCPRFPSLFWEESTKTAAPHCTHFFFFSFPLNLQFISHRARLLTQSDVAAAAAAVEVEPNNPPSSSSFFLPSFSRSHWPCFSRALDVWIHCAFLSPSLAPLCQIGSVYHVCTRPRRRRPHGEPRDPC